MNRRHDIPYFDPDADFCDEDYVRENFRDKVASVDDPSFLAQLMALWAYLLDGPLPSDLVLVLFALGYFIFPLDVIPDITPFIGWLDDALVVSAVVGILGVRLVPYLEE